MRFSLHVSREAPPRPERLHRLASLRGVQRVGDSAPGARGAVGVRSLSRLRGSPCFPACSAPSGAHRGVNPREYDFLQTELRGRWGVATELLLDAQQRVFHARAGYGRKSRSKHGASHRRSASALGILAAVQQWLLLTHRSSNLSRVCLLLWLLIIIASRPLAKLMCVLFIDFPLVPLLFPTQHVI